MLFGRKVPAGLAERVRTSLWPRRSFWRSGKYFAKRALRLSASPHAIASGVAAGVFVIPGYGLMGAVVAPRVSWARNSPSATNRSAPSAR